MKHCTGTIAMALAVLKDTGIPIFFFQVTDPVGAGLIKTIGEPTGTNVAGRVFTVPAQVRTNLAMRLVSQAVPADRPVDFWWEPQSPLGEHPEYTRLLLGRSAVPVAMGQTLDSVKMGALMHIAPDLAAGGREAADLVMAILKGTDPGTISVTAPARFQLGINLTTALKLNIVVPQDILALAGKHVFR